MSFLQVLAFTLLTVSLLAGCRPAPKPAGSLPTKEVTIPVEPKGAQSKLATIPLYIGPVELEAEVALSWQESSTGMMFRTNMPEMSGMLFALPQVMQASFWMKNCPLPLSIAYINPDGVIEEIHDLHPHNTNSVKSAAWNIRYALEVNQGWFERHEIKPGTLIRTPRGSLDETFFRNAQPNSGK